MNLVQFGCKASSRNLLRWVANNADCFHNPKRKRGAMLQSLAYASGYEQSALAPTAPIVLEPSTF
jgi:hypothetical protein